MFGNFVWFGLVWFDTEMFFIKGYIVSLTCERVNSDMAWSH